MTVSCLSSCLQSFNDWDYLTFPCPVLTVPCPVLLCRSTLPLPCPCWVGLPVIQTIFARTLKDQFPRQRLAPMTWQLFICLLNFSFVTFVLRARVLNIDHLESNLTWRTRCSLLSLWVQLCVCVEACVYPFCLLYLISSLCLSVLTPLLWPECLKQ